jgi:hypothetical protein
MFALCKFSNKKLARVEIHPIEQGFARPLPQRGRPMLAQGEVANRVLDRVTRLSQRYGTKVVSRNGIGIIEV